MRVTTRSSRPRARTLTARCGAWGRPSKVRTTPGFTVWTSQRPSGSVALRPKPRNPAVPYSPSGAACHVSTTPSGTGSPSPSSSRPRIQMPPWEPTGTTSGPSGHGSTRARNGPTVCDGVRPRTGSGIGGRLEGRGVGSPQDDVEAEAEGPLGLGDVVVVARHQPLAGPFVGNRVEDRVLEEQRISGEVHLGHQPLRERPPEQ